MKGIQNTLHQKRVTSRVWLIMLFIANMACILISSNFNRAQAQTPEDAAIKKVLKGASEAFYKRNADAWSASWSHSPQVSRMRASSLGYDVIRGWDKLSAPVMQTFKNNPEAVAVNIVQDSFLIRVDGKLATAEYTETLSNFPDNPAAKFHSKRHSVLQKENNQWKIVSMVSVHADTYENNDNNTEARINAAGYSLLASKKFDEAIELFMLNVKLYPKSWNTYDSLGEAYALKGNKELAIKNYEKSMELNPKNDNGKEALAKLKLK